MSQPGGNSASPPASAAANEEPETPAAFASHSSYSSLSSQVREGGGEEYRDRDEAEYHRFPHPETERERGRNYSRENLDGFHDLSSVDDNSSSGVISVLTFWLFVSLTLILGVYGTVDIRLGPNSSVLFQPNPVFVQSLTVEDLNGTNSGLMLYGFYKSPALDVVNAWSKVRNLYVPADSYQDSLYFLNKGSQINISYHVKSPGFSLVLVVAEGNEGLNQWLLDPKYPNTTLSWNVIYGSGVVQQNIPKSSSYHVAVGNLNSKEINVKLTVEVRALLYNTTESFSKCSFSSGKCSSSILFPSENAFLLTSPKAGNGSHDDYWNVKLFYGPRWTTYVLGIAGMTLLMLAVFSCFKRSGYNQEEGTTALFEGVAPHRAPLLSQKDDNLSCQSSSCGSVSDDEKGYEDSLAVSSLERKHSRDSENDNSKRRLCAICFDAPRECFFLPCGHCVACFSCGTRITGAAGTCPICRRNIRKVRKIYTV